MKLKEDIKIRWINKLLNTPIQGQVRHSFRSLDRVCAVGVLYNLAAEEGVISEEWMPGTIPFRGLGRWALQDFDPDITPPEWPDEMWLPSLGSDVMSANDSGVPWPVLADAIKQDL